MSIEQGVSSEEIGNKPEEVKNQEGGLKERLDREVNARFETGKPLHVDALNFWTILSSVNEEMAPEKIESLLDFQKKHSLLHYEESFRRTTNENVQNYINEELSDEAEKYAVYATHYVNRIMLMSDEKVVEKYDQLVDRFNSEFEELYKNKNIKVMNAYATYAEHLIKNIPIDEEMEDALNSN